MKKTICCMMVICLLTMVFPLNALADHMYLLDSDTRLITQTELWDWDRESLSFMFNEIFARHGFQFDVGGKFYEWFNDKPWYQNTAKVSDQAAYSATTELEWKNYDTIKTVIKQMEAANHPYRKTPGSKLKSWTDYPLIGIAGSLSGFKYVNISGEQRLDVYSAPSTNSWRGSNGKAMLNTNGAVWAAGWENGWLMVYYVLTAGDNAGGIRVGYVNGNQIRGSVNMSEYLNFSRTSCKILSSCSLTDDPLRHYSSITTLSAGTNVTYLSTKTNQNGVIWDYIETTYQGQKIRGFIPSGNLNMPAEKMPNVGAYHR